MEIANKILQNEEYQRIMDTIEIEEENREFCRHNIEHCLSVARIAYIENLERSLGIDKDVIYSVALLHDIGRLKEFKDYSNHDEAGATWARKILREIGVDETSVNIIADAIFNHGNRYICESDDICGLIYRADKRSRQCFTCESKPQCNWPSERKNVRIYS